MKAIKYIGFALASVMLFAQCAKDGNAPDLKEDDDQDQNDGTGDWSHWDTGDKFYGTNEWSEVIVGDIPLIISAPHDGDIFVPGVQFRDDCYPPTQVATGRDSHTRALTYELGEYFLEEYGMQPYLIINHLHRRIIDQNRNNVGNEGDAFCPGEAEMEVAWYDFHNYIDTALWRAVEKHGFALYIDMHAHGHAIQRLELGYRLSSNQLLQIYNRENLTSLRNRSSISDALRMDQTGTRLSFVDLIMGDNAFGTLMANEGIRSVPSKDEPHPDGAPFFSGGYNTNRYTKDSQHPNVYGFQIEAHSSVRTEANRPEFVKKLAKVILDYIEYTKPR